MQLRVWIYVYAILCNSWRCLKRVLTEFQLYKYISELVTWSTSVSWLLKPQSVRIRSPTITHVLIICDEILFLMLIHLHLMKFMNGK